MGATYGVRCAMQVSLQVRFAKSHENFRLQKVSRKKSFKHANPCMKVPLPM